MAVQVDRLAHSHHPTRHPRLRRDHRLVRYVLANGRRVDVNFVKQAGLDHAPQHVAAAKHGASHLGL